MQQRILLHEDFPRVLQRAASLLLADPGNSGDLAFQHPGDPAVRRRPKFLTLAIGCTGGRFRSVAFALIIEKLWGETFPHHELQVRHWCVQDWPSWCRRDECSECRREDPGFQRAWDRARQVWARAVEA